MKKYEQAWELPKVWKRRKTTEMYPKYEQYEKYQKVLKIMKMH